MKKSKKVLALTGVLLLSASTLMGCGSSNNTSTTAGNANATGSQAQTQASADLSGSITMAGSTSMEKLANALGEVFMQKYSNVTVNAEFSGSSAGIESLLAGSVDIGNSSRNLSDEEKSKGAVENIVAIDGIAVVVDPANKVEDLSKENLYKIYTGEITNWSELGGDDQAIVVVGREAASGTRGAFEEILDAKDKCKYANELDSTGAVMAKVASTKGAIGYVSLDVLDDSVKAVKLDGVEATVDNIKNGSYLLQRPFVMATKGEISEQSDEVKALFDFLKSDEGKQVVTSVGLITVD